jgi:hypothetical protein
VSTVGTQISVGTPIAELCKMATTETIFETPDSEEVARSLAPPNEIGSADVVCESISPTAAFEVFAGRGYSSYSARSTSRGSSNHAF